MGNYDDFDLDRSTAQAWTEFQSRLSEVLAHLDDSADLTIGTESAGEEQAPFLHFSAPEGGLVRAEAAGNAVLGERYQLGNQQLQDLEDAGWQPPTTTGARPTANFWVELPQSESERISALAVSALRDVYGVFHPVFLAPDQLAEILKPPPEPLPDLPGYAPEDVVATMPSNQGQLDRLVDAELVDMFGHRPMRDSEGDIALRVGSTMLFLRTTPDGQEVIVFSTVVHEVDGRSRAAEVLNDLNCQARWVKFSLIRDRVFVTLSVPARPFVPAHLHQAVRIMSEVADGIDNELATKLHGRTTFGDSPEVAD